MRGIAELHRAAMEKADEADRCRRTGDIASARIHLQKALDLERRAAEQTVGQLSLEPTRSILHRSAASLAIEFEDYREAERLIAVALAGNPPDEVAKELRDLLQRVYFEGPAKGRRRVITRQPAELSEPPDGR